MRSKLWPHPVSMFDTNMVVVANLCSDLSEYE